jgi:hypothetical protein
MGRPKRTLGSDNPRMEHGDFFKLLTSMYPDPPNLLLHIDDFLPFKDGYRPRRFSCDVPVSRLHMSDSDVTISRTG